MRLQPKAALQAVRRERPALVHFHDPELLPLGVRLAAEGLPTIYDVHEDVPRQIHTKQWIPAPLRGLVSGVFERYEDRQASRVSAVVAATPHIAQRFAPRAARCVTIDNFPLLSEFMPLDGPVPRERSVCYVGGIMRTRGALQTVRAMALLPDVRLLLCGRFEDAALEAELRAEPGWAQIDYLGQVGRPKVREVLARASAGLVTLLPMPSYIDSLPTKMFEYMSAELPVVASNFPLWRDIVDQHGCGLCVDPTRPAAIADAIRSLVDSPARVASMGAAGRLAIYSTFNWSRSEQALLDLYRSLLGP